MRLDKFTSYEGYAKMEDTDEQELVDQMAQQYEYEYGEVLNDPSTPTWREYVTKSLQTLQWRVEVDIPEKRKKATKIIVPDRVEHLIAASEEDYDAAIDVCRSATDVLERYLARQGQTFIITTSDKAGGIPV